MHVSGKKSETKISGLGSGVRQARLNTVQRAPNLAILFGLFTLSCFYPAFGPLWRRSAPTPFNAPLFLLG